MNVKPFRGEVTRSEHHALRAIPENINDACNRRVQQALDSVEAALKTRLAAITEEQRGMSDPFSPEYLLKSGRTAMLLDLMDEIPVIRRGF